MNGTQPRAIHEKAGTTTSGGRRGGNLLDRLPGDEEEFRSAGAPATADVPRSLAGEPSVNAWAAGEALLIATFTVALRSMAGTRPGPPGTTRFDFAPERVFRSLLAVAVWLGATVHAVNEDAHWVVLLNPLRDCFLPHELLTVSVVGRDDGSLVDIRPRGVEGLAFTVCAMTLISETSRLLELVATPSRLGMSAPRAKSPPPYS